MTIQRIERLVIALIVSLICAGVALVVAQARPASAPAIEQAAPQFTADCQACHKDQYATWQQGPHAQALTDSAFQDAWMQQGQPGACLACHTTGYNPITGAYEEQGVACTACHAPVPGNHPTENMPVDKTTQMCSNCHSGVQFGVPNWQVSTHYQRDLTCSVCHDPHTTSLRSVAGETLSENPSELCTNCHKDYGTDFTHSAHGAAGVTCIDCHLDMGNEPITFSNAHTVPDHNFMPELSTCTACHARQMHADGESAAVQMHENTPISEEINNVAPVAESPAPVSPLGFAGVAGLLGLAGGMVTAPWLERAYDRMNNKRGG